MAPDMFQARNVDHFKKTKMCKFEILGMCNKGRSCPFAHGAEELHALPDLRFTKVCKTLIARGVCEDPDCTYAHNRDELRTMDAAANSSLRKPCRFFIANRRCPAGSQCSFAHTIVESQQCKGTLQLDQDRSPQDCLPDSALLKASPMSPMKVPLQEPDIVLPPTRLDQKGLRPEPEEAVWLGGALKCTSVHLASTAASQSVDNAMLQQSCEKSGEVVFAAGFLWHTPQDGLRIDQKGGALKDKPWECTVGGELFMHAECPAKVFLPSSGTSETTESTFCSLSDVESDL